MGSHFGVGAPPIFRTYFSGDWDVHLVRKKAKPLTKNGCLFELLAKDGSTFN